MNTNTEGTEVTWDGGAGHQPYGNRSLKSGHDDASGQANGPAEQEADQPSHGNQFSEGDRQQLSGNNQKQLEEVKGVP